MEDARMREMLQLFGEYRTEEKVSVSALDIETKRNTDNIDLFEAIIREVYAGVTLVVAGHHVMFMREGHPLPGEIASADTLIFDHGVARKIWKEHYKEALTALALEPTANRDALLRQLYYARNEPSNSPE